MKNILVFYLTERASEEAHDSVRMTCDAVGGNCTAIIFFEQPENKVHLYQDDKGMTREQLERLSSRVEDMIEFLSKIKQFKPHVIYGTAAEKTEPDQ